MKVKPSATLRLVLRLALLPFTAKVGGYILVREKYYYTKQN